MWTVSNGRCYAPDCVMPVVLEVRPGVYQKNSQVAHIYGIRPGTPRYRPDMPGRERDSFASLLLLCTAHHEEVDGKNGEDLYPPETLRSWKAQHEGAAGSVLKNLAVPSTDALIRGRTHEIAPRAHSAARWPIRRCRRRARNHLAEAD
jgi:hypothetical protein